MFDCACVCGWVGDGGVREVGWGSALNTGLQLSNSLSNTSKKHRSVIKQKQSTKITAEQNILPHHDLKHERHNA